MKRVLLTFIMSVLVSLSAIAQDRDIKGKVTDETGQGLPGVNVLIKGTTTGVATQPDGTYQLSAPESGVLVFRFLGYVTQEVQIGTQTTIDIQLNPDATDLGEIVVSGVAAGTPRKKLTVTVAKIDAERLSLAPATSAGNALAGKVAGVRITQGGGTPGNDASIQLRADNNLNVGSGPMVVIDGVIIEGGLSDLNVDDIESYEVIKGASAASLYGSRAGNGVIVITSKRGNNQNIGTTNITVRNEIGWQQLERTIDLAEHHAFTLAPDYASFDKFTKYAGVTYPAGYVGGFSPDIVGNRGFDADHYMDNPFGRNIDQQEAFFRTGSNHTNYVAVSTRNATTNAFISFENNAQTGIIPNTDGFARQNIRLNIDHQINDWLKFSASNLIANSTQNNPGGGGGIFFNIVLAEPDNDLFLPNPDGQPYYYRHNHWSNESNPLYSTYKTENRNEEKRIIGNYRLNFDLASWVNFEASYSTEFREISSGSYSPYDTWTLGGTDPLGITYSLGSLSENTSERNVQQVQTTMNLNGRFGDITAKGKISYLYENSTIHNVNTSGFDFGIRDLPTLSAIPTANISSSNYQQEVIASNYFFIGSLDYKDKILFDGMFRIDGSSLFGENERWNNYYRLSAGYRITEDLDIPNVQELKIRGAYGVAGIRPGFDWQYETYSVSNGIASASTLGNKNLKPSRTAETEVAINAEFLNRFTLEAIYANSVTSDQFLSVRLLPIAGGFSSQYQNAGSIESNTFELNLGANIIKNENLTWDANLVFSRTRQTVTELPIAPYTFGTDGLFYVKEGETYGSIYGNTWVKSLDQMAQQLPEGDNISDYEVNNEGYVVPAGSQGTVNEAPIKLKDENGLDAFVKIGDGNPDFYAGFSNTFRYKGFTAYVLLDIKEGGDVYNRKSQWLTRDDRNGIMDQFGKADSEKKALEYYKGFYDVNSNNSYWVEDASFVKLREVALGYTFTATQLQNFFGFDAFKGASLRAIGRNLVTFTDYSGYDPEVGSIRNPVDGTGTYPNFRNYALSLSLNF